jgi:putative methyltransferase (TIGR01177 family)
VRVLATAAPDEEEKAIRSVPWRRYVRTASFCVRLTRIGVEGGVGERELAALVLSTVTNPKIDLQSPDLIIDIVRTRSRTYIGIRAWEDKEDWNARRAHLWPVPHPTALYPALARALVRLGGTQRIHDPCCGAGGIVIEAGLAGMHVSGGDISAEMIARARKNATRYGLRPEFRVVDAASWIPRVGAIVTDIPYGRSTKHVRVTPFVEALLMRAAQSAGLAVIGSAEALHAVSGWVVRARFESYVHKSLTRHFTVFERTRR